MYKIISLLFTCAFTLIFFPAFSDVSTEIRPVKPTAIYGPKDAPLELILGNGGAGPTCLLQELSEDFIKTHHLTIQIGWIQTISRLTLENLKDKVIDISLTYEAEPEKIAIQNGWASARTLVFNDHFILVGPKDNPADLKPSDSIEEAFKKIQLSQSKFLSRNDFSGSNERERFIWSSLNSHPWEQKPSWYITQKVFPADALRKADKESLYTLTDRGTLIAYQTDLQNTAVYIQNGEILMNRCHAMLQRHPTQLAKDFLKYLNSDRAQNIIDTYAGKNQKNCINCCPLFTSAHHDTFLEKNCLEKLGFAPFKQ
jgi:ABC-type tungstate transport system permease subunit